MCDVRSVRKNKGGEGKRKEMGFRKERRERKESRAGSDGDV